MWFYEPTQSKLNIILMWENPCTPSEMLKSDLSVNLKLFPSWKYTHRTGDFLLVIRDDTISHKPVAGYNKGHKIGPTV